MDWLNYHHLRHLWKVSREGGLPWAAEKLHVSPPSISAQIRELVAHRLDLVLGVVETHQRLSSETKQRA